MVSWEVNSVLSGSGWRAGGSGRERKRLKDAGQNRDEGIKVS